MIKLKNISVKINDAYILKDFNLTIEKGEKILISGKSGIGKSTLLKLLLGFTFPDSGSIHFNDIRLDKNNVWDFRKNFAYVCQDLDIGQGEVITLIKEVFAFRINSDPGLDTHELINLLEIFELGKEILHKNFEELSGGEKQRIVIIISVLLKREIILLDEVTSALDENLKKKVIDYFLDRNDLTAILISHDTEYKQNSKLRKINLEAQK
jgi:putative ABC transport system ATP-binding protein